MIKGINIIIGILISCIVFISCKKDTDIGKLNTNPYDRDYEGEIWFNVEYAKRDHLSNLNAIPCAPILGYSREYALEIKGHLNIQYFENISPTTKIQVQELGLGEVLCNNTLTENSEGTVYASNCLDQSSTYTMICSEFDAATNSFAVWRVLTQDELNNPNKIELEFFIGENDALGSAFTLSFN